MSQQQGQRPAGYIANADEAKAIAAGGRVEEFLADPVVQEAFARAERDAFEAWKDAKTVADREAIHAQVAALARFQTSLQIAKDRGQYAQREVAGKQRRGER